MTLNQSRPVHVACASIFPSCTDNPIVYSVHDLFSTSNKNTTNKYNNNYTFCSAALCPDPADIVNGMVTVAGNSVGDTTTYSCNPGFELIGSATAICMQVDANSAVFSSAPPVCRRES